MRRLVVTAPIKSGSHETVRQLLADGPPFDVAATSLDRHEVYLAEDELIFIFEGPHADREVGRLLQNAFVAEDASRIAAHLAGSPRVASEMFSWERDADAPSLSFAPTPGPGDSDGG